MKILGTQQEHETQLIGTQ